ncbi:hypothetical protein TorRG33x02_013260 [Trema orientale]|uniref:Uncharacterized protein n=1 Tax=Trema orientale TaxID=63057 RepID=A0A2P5FZQ4_TREOI|nr:hypothetical protein TorRG33x02_013260 [Trema orientale]
MKRNHKFAQTSLLHDPPSQPLAPPRLHFRAAPQTANAVAPPPSTTPASKRHCQALKQSSTGKPEAGEEKIRVRLGGGGEDGPQWRWGDSDIHVRWQDQG